MEEEMPAAIKLLFFFPIIFGDGKNIGKRC